MRRLVSNSVPPYARAGHMCMLAAGAHASSPHAATRGKRGIKRREELTKVFGAMSRAELKKGLQAMGFEEAELLHNKDGLVSALVDRFAPKKKKRAGADE